MSRPNNFYDNPVSQDEFEWVTDDSTPLPSDVRPNASRMLPAKAAAVAMVAFLVFGPVAAMSGSNVYDSDVSEVTVRFQDSSSFVEQDPLATAHIKAAARFNRLFKDAPDASDDDALDPDYGL